MKVVNLRHQSPSEFVNASKIVFGAKITQNFVTSETEKHL